MRTQWTLKTSCPPLQVDKTAEGCGGSEEWQEASLEMLETIDGNSTYTVSIDEVGKDEWAKYLLLFEDASIFQTWTYGSVRWHEANLSRVVLKRGDAVVAMAQARIVKVPLLGSGIAYVFWGPLWRLRGRASDPENLRMMLRALQQEYVLRRRLLLRVVPNIVDDAVDGGQTRGVFAAEGLRWVRPDHRTALLDLAPSMDELRKKLKKGWRRELTIAEGKSVKINEGSADCLYGQFSKLYREMLNRKRFMPGVDINEFQQIQKELPDSFKMKILVSEFDGKPVAAVVASLLGDTGIYLLGATSSMGLNLKASYLLQWRTIQWLKESGASWYDLNGYNPEKTPGTAFFKAGLSGREICHIGQFEACRSILSYFAVKSGDLLRVASRRIQASLGQN